MASPQTPHTELTFGTTPNYLTLVRIVMTPIVVWLMFLNTYPGDFAALVIFVIASITDYFDGYLARKQNLITIYGKLMDPLADKILVVSALVMLQHLDRIHPTIVILLICREMAITGLRALASAEGVIIAASDSAKWKTVTQMVAIPFLIAPVGFLNLPVHPIGTVLILISLAISLWSAKSYVVEFFRSLKETHRQKLNLRRLARATRKAATRSRLKEKIRRFRKNQS